MKKICGPFFYYVNTGSQADCIAEAKVMAHQQKIDWPYQWFENDLYPRMRTIVSGCINLSGNVSTDSFCVLLGEPSTERYRQSKGYMFWTRTDKLGNFTIRNVRPDSYSLYAYALNGEVTDELEKTDIEVSGDNLNLGSIDWIPTKYENLLFQIGQADRMSDGFKWADGSAHLRPLSSGAGNGNLYRRREQRNRGFLLRTSGKKLFFHQTKIKKRLPAFLSTTIFI